jgi:hypothetical protein
MVLSDAFSILLRYEMVPRIAEFQMGLASSQRTVLRTFCYGR